MAKNNAVCGVYMIKNLVNGKVYIGSSINCANRFYLHKWSLKANRHQNARLQHSWAKHGAEAFSFEVVEETPRENRIAAEQKLIDALRSVDPDYGYNIAPIAGCTEGVPCSESTRRKIAEANKGRVLSEAALKNKREAMSRPEVKAKLKAVRRSDELKARVSLTKGGTGKILSPSEIEIIRQKYASGEFALKALAAEFCVSYQAIRKNCEGVDRGDVAARISRTLTGRKLPPEHVANSAAAMRGKKRSEETKVKIGAAHRGRRPSDACLNAASVANRARSARNRQAIQELSP